jgi:hypothetical protein
MSRAGPLAHIGRAGLANVQPNDNTSITNIRMSVSF